MLNVNKTTFNSMKQQKPDRKYETIDNQKEKFRNQFLYTDQLKSSTHDEKGDDTYETLTSQTGSLAKAAYNSFQSLFFGTSSSNPVNAGGLRLRSTSMDDEGAVDQDYIGADL